MWIENRIASNGKTSPLRAANVEERGGSHDADRILAPVLRSNLGGSTRLEVVKQLDGILRRQILLKNEIGSKHANKNAKMRKCNKKAKKKREAEARNQT